MAVPHPLYVRRTPENVLERQIRAVVYYRLRCARPSTTLRSSSGIVRDAAGPVRSRRFRILRVIRRRTHYCLLKDDGAWFSTNAGEIDIIAPHARRGRGDSPSSAAVTVRNDERTTIVRRRIRTIIHARKKKMGIYVPYVGETDGREYSHTGSPLLLPVLRCRRARHNNNSLRLFRSTPFSVRNYGRRPRNSRHGRTRIDNV